MDVVRQETAFHAHCARCGDSFDIPFAELRPMLGGALPSAAALAASLTCICSLNDERGKAGASTPLWRWPTVRSGL